MRITSANAFDNTVSSMQRRQQELVDAQERLTSGKRVARPSDDPTGAARAERALAQMQRSEANQRALEASRNAMVQAEQALGDASSLLQQARERVVAAGNGGFNDKDRATIAQELRGLRTQLLGIANRGDGAGSPLFGGQGSAATPFLDTANGVHFDGMQGQLQLASGEPLPLTVDGQTAFLGSLTTATNTYDLSMFSVLDRVATELETVGATGPAVAQTVADGLRDLDIVFDRVNGERARAGEVLNRTDAVEQRSAQSKLLAQTERSNAEDLDMLEAVSDFQNRQSSYDAALKTYTMVQRMSLFQYLNV